MGKGLLFCQVDILFDIRKETLRGILNMAAVMTKPNRMTMVMTDLLNGCINELLWDEDFIGS